VSVFVALDFDKAHFIANSCIMILAKKTKTALSFSKVAPFRFIENLLLDLEIS
jgi:formate/nitrite transporter FocA (FNT family)